jgi:uncharacterized membrane protein YebE (DUF533 family)
MSAERLVGSLILGALGVRRKRNRRTLRYLTGGRGSSLLTPGVLLGAAGVAWGVYEAATRGTGGGVAPVGTVPPLPGATPPPPPLPAAATAPTGQGVPPEVLRLVRLTVSAARADGTLSAEEREEILRHAREAGAEAVVEAELASPVPLSTIVAGADDPRLKSALYQLAFSLVRADEQVTGAERIYLAQLAHALGLDAATTARLESEAAAGIQEQDEDAG